MHYSVLQLCARPAHFQVALTLSPVLCVRQDYFCSIPQHWTREQYGQEQYDADDVDVGQVICFFTARLRYSKHSAEEVSLAFVMWLDTYQQPASEGLFPALPATTGVRGPDSCAAGSVVDQHFGTRKLYRPAQPWYDVIESWRILGMEPLVPDFSNDGRIPKGFSPDWARQGKAGCDLYVRNRFARRFGRCFRSRPPPQTRSGPAGARDTEDMLE
jgi:hypothetical protein